MTTLGTGRLVGIGFSHLLAPLSCRERAMVAEAEVARTLKGLAAELGAREAVLLATCSRLELYAAADDPAEILSRARSWFLARAGAEVGPSLSSWRGEEALAHLFKVASGLDSWIIGESEILGQVKRAYETARAAGLTAATLNRAFQSAAAAGKSVRAETGIQQGVHSIGGAAALLARSIFGESSGGATVIFGAGEAARAAARHLAAKNFSKIYVANRTVEKARALASEIGGLGVGLDEGLRLLGTAEIGVFSVSCERPVLEAAALERLTAGRRRPLFLLDLGLPRNVAADCAGLSDTYLYNLDDLKGVVARSVAGKAVERSRAQALAAQAARDCAAELDKAAARRLAAAAA
ncbi:MAG: glutamyl-tRNA reductase [Elusimicrobia bacterium]|nr:glutamyl-tRNA reductase [Elusimicrobiota bacterium]